MSKKNNVAHRLALAVTGLTALAAIATPAYAEDIALQSTNSAIASSHSTSLTPEPTSTASSAQLVTNKVNAEAEVNTKADDIDLPDTVKAAVFREITTRSAGIELSDLRVVEARRDIWSDGCLGLAEADTACTQAQVPGWLVVATDGLQSWVYRTDETGSVIAFDQVATENQTVAAETRVETTSEQATQAEETQTAETQIESRTTITETQVTTGTVVEQDAVEVEQRSQAEVSVQRVEFSQTVQTAVFQAIAQRSQVQTSQLRVVEARQVTWADGCLGIPNGNSCTQAQVPGWVVVVTDGEQSWVCRTNQSGSLVVYDAVATETRMAQLRARQGTRITFTDVAANYWANRFIVELAELDIIAGYPDGSYRPDRAVTRAEFAAIIRRAFEVTEVRQAVNFVDVDEEYWAYTAIEEAYEMDFLGAASNNQFRPLSSLTRGESLFALARGLRLSTRTAADTLLTTYRDVRVTGESRLLLAALAEQGIVANYPDVRLLNLDRVATRAEVAVFIYQTLASLGRVESIASPYVLPGAATVIQNGNPVQTADDATRRNCNQGIGNGAEGCDPGNSAPRGGSNDEGGRTPSNPAR